MECLGKVVRSQREEIWIGLQEVQGRTQLEFRVYGTPGPGNASPIPRGEGLDLPIDQIPSLLRVLTLAQEVCTSRGLLYVSAPAIAVTMERGEPLTKPIADPAIGARREPRVPLQLKIECRLVDPETFWPKKAISGEIRDISLGGAQVWLPQRFPRFKQVDVALILDGRGFHARAEIMNIELEARRDPKTGFHRHGFRWVAMEPKAREILTEAIAARLKGGGG